MPLKECFRHIRRFYSPLSIRNKVFLFNISIIVLLIAVFAYNSNQISSKAIIDKAIKNSNRELVLIEGSLRTLVSDIEDFSRILSSDFRLQSELYKITKSEVDPVLEMDINSTLSEIISNIIKPNTCVTASSIISSNDIVFDAGGADNDYVNRSFDKSFINHVTDVRVPVWTGLQKLKLSNEKEDNVFAVSKSIVHKDLGKDIGIAVLFISESKFASVYMNNRTNEGDRFYILDENGMIVSTQNKEELYTKFDEKYYGIDRLKQDGHAIINDGKNKVLLTVHYYDDLKWRIISKVSISEITTEIGEINRMIFIVGSLCLLFAFAVSLILSTSITNPVRELVKIMKSIEQGGLDKRVSISSTDEFGMLSKGFNRLMDRIEGLLGEIYAEQKKRREYEYRLIQAQINPHFLYNTIETIISLINLGIKDGAITAAKNLASFYRISLSKGKDIIPVKEELQLINSYLAIQKLRYFEYMDFSVDFAEDILNCKVPKLTLQPLAENSIYHGLKPKGLQGRLSVKGYKHEGCVIFEVIDDGIGMSEERIRKVFSASETHEKESFGLVSVDTRIKLLFGNVYGLDIKSEQGSFTKITVKLPILD